MLPLTPPRRLLVATEPVDCRTGIDGLAALCRRALGDKPLRGAVSGCRNRARTTRTMLVYDGPGGWLCPKRLSQGRCTGWPATQDASMRLSAREWALMLWHGHPPHAGRADDGRQLAEGGARLACACHGSHAAGAFKTAGRGACHATQESKACTPAWRQVAMRRVSLLALEALEAVASTRLLCRWRIASFTTRSTLCAAAPCRGHRAMRATSRTSHHMGISVRLSARLANRAAASAPAGPAAR
jgi:hypothetical protein